LREYIYSIAPLLLCNFTIKNGRFGMMPALPVDSGNRISTGPISIEQIFTAGNILEGSLSVQYIPAAQRKNFRAVVSYRTNIPNELPSQSAVLVEWADLSASNLPEETINLTSFCTSREQALITARFALSGRRRVDHTISFKSAPDSLAIAPGSYIRVITESSSYSAANNGVIQDAGTLITVSEITDGTYEAVIFLAATGEIIERPLTISGGVVTDSALYNSIFTLLQPKTAQSVYQIEQLSLDEDGLVDIAAVYVPTNDNLSSIVAIDVTTPELFRVFE
jgi:predicted phage tail protein